MNLKQLIRTVPDFPSPGIQFKDIESIIENPAAFSFVTQQFANAINNRKIDKILSLDARGFLFGAALANKVGLPLVMARKKGKLPGECVAQTYSLEYGEATIELQKTAISRGEIIMIIDDLLATGGTAQAAADLVTLVGGTVSIFAFVIELDDLKGRAPLKLAAQDADIISLVHY